jgi:hypothetical protein
MVKVGDTFAADYCDGRYRWTVDEVIDGRVVLASSEEATRDWGIGQKAYTVEDVGTSMKLDDFWEQHRRVHDSFWDNVQVGAMIHYHNGFGEWVRGTVIERDGKKLLDPTAMVGDWTHHWEYHWAKLVRGDGAWQPSVSNIYESGQWSRGDTHGDPTTMEPLDFSDRTNGYLDYLLKQEA